MRERFSTSKLPRETQDQVQVRILKCGHDLVIIELDLGFAWQDVPASGAMRLLIGNLGDSRALVLQPHNGEGWLKV